MSDKPHYHGHRERLRERFLKGGPEALQDYELLELILFMAKPRGDVKPVAKELISTFGSFAEVIGADIKRLKEVRGVGDTAAAAIKAVEASAIHLARGKVMERPVLSSWQTLNDYIHASMAYLDSEHFRVLFLNKKNTLIADEVQHQGTVDQTMAYPREIIKRALDLGATAVIMVHNHPSGDPTPSRADIDFTKDVKDAGERLGIILHDHVIVSKNGHYSFKAHQLI